MFGTSSEYTVQDVEGQLKRTLVSGLSDAIAESKLPALDLAANYDEIGDYALKTINPRIEKLGLTLASFVIENNISSVIIYNTCPVYKVQTAQNRKYTYFNRLVGVNRVIKRLNNVK